MNTPQGLLDALQHHKLLILCIGPLVYACVSFIIKIVYRLYFHPLAKFPGPKIAAATHLYEVAWDYFGKGAYLYEIQRMHEKYGKCSYPPEDEIDGESWLPKADMVVKAQLFE